MAHLTDCSTSPNDLLDKLRIWLLARGWMVDSYIADGAGYRLHLHKGTTYLNFRSFNNETPTPWKGAGSGYGIAFNMGTGYSAASNWYSQPGIPLLSGTEPAGTGILLGPGPYQSHQFFDDGQGNFLILVERTPGIWRKLAWGDSLDKSGAGSWVGGAYFSGFTSLVTGAVAMSIPGRRYLQTMPQCPTAFHTTPAFRILSSGRTWIHSRING